MSESSRTTTDGRAGETLNVEELFATEDTDISIDEGDTDAREPGTQTTSAAAEDTTAGEVFAQLREDHTDAKPRDEDTAVAEESPEDIMARADEAAQHVDQIDDAIRADEGALDDLLLAGRREADGFLWVETEDDGNDADEMTSLFQSSEASTDANATSVDDAGDDGHADDANADDDFSLDPADNPSFETRAASFDDPADEFRLDANDIEAKTDDASDEALDDASDDSRNDDSRNDARREPTGDADSTHPMDGTRPQTTDERSKSDSSDTDNGGLASRIRSILSG